MPYGEVFIAADVGGTKTELGLFTIKSELPHLIKKERFLNSQFHSLLEVIDSFVTKENLKNTSLPFLSLGIAAPVGDGPIRLTNINWIIDKEELKEELHVGKVYAINDIVACAWGIPLLQEEELFTLNEGTKREGNIALICAGTGLGESIVVYNNGRYIPVPSEGGHADFAPESPVEVGLLFYLQEKYGHVSYERVASGQGIKNIYDFLSMERLVPNRIRERFEKEDPPSVITEEALKEYGDLACRETLEIFISVLAREASNLALKGLARGGVYVGGGIAPKVLSAMKDGRFMASFVRKGRFRGFLEELPVHVILKPEVVLFGAANYGVSRQLNRELRI